MHQVASHHYVVLALGWASSRLKGDSVVQNGRQQKRKK